MSNKRLWKFKGILGASGPLILPPCVRHCIVLVYGNEKFSRFVIGTYSNVLTNNSRYRNKIIRFNDD